MDAILALAAICGAITVGAVSPGPSFLLVARISVASSRIAGLGAALGMGIGGVIFAALALAGLAAILTQFAWAYLILKIGGGLYLCWLAILIWRGADQPLTVTGDAAESRSGALRGFWLGLITQVSNPKAIVIYTSVFAALMPQSVPAWFYMAVPAALFAIECGWYVIVALVFSMAGPRAVYLGAKRWLDRAAGAVMGLLGLRLLTEAARG